MDQQAYGVRINGSSAYQELELICCSQVEISQSPQLPIATLLIRTKIPAIHIK